MKLINCSKYSDGQGAFKNGMHDHIGGMRHNLYLQGVWHKFAWRCGYLFQRATGLGYVEDTNAVRMARKFKAVLEDMAMAIRCADEEHFRRAWDDACTYLHWQDIPPFLVDGLLSGREYYREEAKSYRAQYTAIAARLIEKNKKIANQRRELAHWHKAYDQLRSDMYDRVLAARNDYKIARHAADEASRQRDEQATLIAQLRAELNSARTTINAQGATIEQLGADGPHLSVLQALVPNLFKPE